MIKFSEHFGLSPLGIGYFILFIILSAFIIFAIYDFFEEGGDPIILFMIIFAIIIAFFIWQIIRIDKVSYLETASITEIEKMDDNYLEENKDAIKSFKKYEEREKIVIKRKIDNYLKENNIELSNDEYLLALKNHSISLEDKVVNFKASVKEILSIPIEDIK